MGSRDETRFAASVAQCAGGSSQGDILSAVSPDFNQASPGGVAGRDATSTVSAARLSGIAGDLSLGRESRGKRCLVAAANRPLKSMTAAGVSFRRARV